MDWDNFDQIKARVQICGTELRYASPRLQDSDEIVAIAVQKSGWALRFASPRLQDDEKMASLAINNWAFSLKYASPRLKDSDEIVAIALRQDGDALRFASPRIKRAVTRACKSLKTDDKVQGFAYYLAQKQAKELRALLPAKKTTTKTAPRRL